MNGNIDIQKIIEQIKNLNITPQQLSQILNSISGGVTKTEDKISTMPPENKPAASFSASNIPQIFEFLSKSFGLDRLSSTTQDISRQLSDISESYQRSLSLARESLLKEKEATLSRAREDIESFQRQLSSQLGLTPGIGSGFIEDVQKTYNRAIQTLNLLSAQYDKAIAQLNFDVADKILEQQQKILNLNLASLSNFINLASSLLQTSVQLSQQPYQEELQRQQIKANEIQMNLNALDNILKLYEGRSVSFDKLPKQTQQRLLEISQKTGIPLDAIKNALLTTQPSQIITVNNEAGIPTKIGMVIGDSIVWKDIPGVSDIKTKSIFDAPTVSNYLNGLISTSDLPSLTQQERLEIGEYLSQISKIPVYNLIEKLRQKIEENKSLVKGRQERTINLSTILNTFTLTQQQRDEIFKKYSKTFKKDINRLETKKSLFADVIFNDIVNKIEVSSISKDSKTTEDRKKQNYIRILSTFYPENELKNLDENKLKDLLLGVVIDGINSLLTDNYLEKVLINTK